MVQEAVLLVLLISSGLTAQAYRGPSILTVPAVRSSRCYHPSRPLGMAGSDKEPRRVVRYDNVGDPVYEDELDSSASGVSVLGIKLSLDPLSLSLLIFGAIAFNFFVLANL